MRIQLILILIITALLLSACGKKGPVRPITNTAIDQPSERLEESSNDQEKQSN